MAPVGLRRGEEAWRAAFERLLERFPHAGPERVAQALRDTNGHAGRAAAALRPKNGSTSARVPQTARAASPGPAEPQVSRLRSELREERLRRELRAERDARRAERAAAESAAEKKMSQAEEDVGDSQNDVRGSEVLVEALAREGRRLRHELDGALAEARAERRRADSLAEAGARGSASGAYDEASLKAVRHVRLLQAEAEAADASSSKLQMELEASRDEGRRLRCELQGALEGGAASAAGVVAGSERERLRRELEIALKEGAAAAAAAAEARSRSSRLQAELDAVLRENPSCSTFVNQEVPPAHATPQTLPSASPAAPTASPPTAPQLTPRRPSATRPTAPTASAETAGAAARSRSPASHFAPGAEAPVKSAAQTQVPGGFSHTAPPDWYSAEGHAGSWTERGTVRASDAEWRRERDRAREEAPADFLRQSTRAASADELRFSGTCTQEFRLSGGERLCTPEAPGTPPPRARGLPLGSGLAPDTGTTTAPSTSGAPGRTAREATEAAARGAAGIAAATSAKLAQPPFELRHEYRHECGRLRDKLAELRATFAAAGAAADAGAGLGRVGMKSSYGGLDPKSHFGSSSLFNGLPPGSISGRRRSTFGGGACGAGEASRFASWRRDPVGLERLEQLWQRS